MAARGGGRLLGIEVVVEDIFELGLPRFGFGVLPGSGQIVGKVGELGPVEGAAPGLGNVAGSLNGIVGPHRPGVQGVTAPHIGQGGIDLLLGSKDGIGRGFQFRLDYGRGFSFGRRGFGGSKIVSDDGLCGSFDRRGFGGRGFLLNFGLDFWDCSSRIDSISVLAGVCKQIVVGQIF